MIWSFVECSNFGWTLLFVFCTSVLLWIRFRRPSDLPPGPTSLPIIGNFHNLANKDFLQAVRDLRKEYGDIFSLSLGQFWVIVVNGSDNLRELLVKRGDVTTDRPKFFAFQLAENKGITSGRGNEWKHQRTFAVSKLREFGFGKRSFESRIHEEIEAFLSLLLTFKGQPFDISHLIQTSMSNNIMSICIGRRFEYDDPKFRYFIERVDENIKNVAFLGPLNFAPFLAKLPGDIFGGKHIIKSIGAIFDFFKDELRQHEKSYDENNIRDFIDVYLYEMKKEGAINQQFTEKQLVYTVTDLFNAGTETSAATIRWALVYLMRNIEMQRKMWKEIDDVVGSERLPSIADKPKLIYCDAVVQESIRLGNVVPFALPHEVSEDIYYKGYRIPKASVIMPSLDSVAYDEKLFPDGQAFKPERFIDENGKLCGQDKMLTFSLGRRVCLGESLARMEVFLYLTALVQRFEFVPPEGEDPPPIEGKLGLTYAPEPFEFRANPRN